MGKVFNMSMLKKGVALSMAVFSFAALAVPCLNASASSQYVCNEHQLRHAMKTRSNVIMANDICVSSVLKIDESLNLDLKGHKLYPAPSYKDSDTIVIGENKYNYPVDVTIENGYIYGVNQPASACGCDNSGLLSCWTRDGEKGKKGGCAIKVNGAHLTLSHVTACGGIGGAGGNGAEAKVRALLPGYAGKGGKGGNGGNAIFICNNGVVDANVVYAVGGNGGIGGNGGSSLVGYISGSAGNGGRGGNAVYAKKGTFNMNFNVTLTGGNGGDAGVCGYSSSNFYGSNGNGGNAGHGFVYTSKGYSSNPNSAAVSGGTGGRGVFYGLPGDGFRYLNK